MIKIFTGVTMKNAVFWDITPCGSCVNRRFGGTSVYTRSTQRHISEDGILQRQEQDYIKLQIKVQQSFYFTYIQRLKRNINLIVKQLSMREKIGTTFKLTVGYTNNCRNNF
jgi:hypothetical protein